jgi:hypothetical protein
MAIRREPIYIQTDTWRCLWLIAKALECTPDEVADSYLMQVVELRHPELLEHRKQASKLEREIIAKIAKQPQKPLDCVGPPPGGKGKTESQ